ncbi:hypothetical protein L209DRAFT_749095 [Thermothelomyces heterothallicus CBS 203.75]
MFSLKDIVLLQALRLFGALFDLSGWCDSVLVSCLPSLSGQRPSSHRNPAPQSRAQIRSDCAVMPWESATCCTTTNN